MERRIAEVVAEFLKLLRHVMYTENLEQYYV